MLPIQCPKCGSMDVRASTYRSFGEQLASVIGFPALRCRKCEHRFKRNLWDVRNCVYARCPNCYGLQLTSWDVENYHVRWLWRVWLTLGANPWRCEPCRRNFVSFLPRKFRWVRRKVASTGNAAGEHSLR